MRTIFSWLGPLLAAVLALGAASCSCGGSGNEWDGGDGDADVDGDADGDGDADVDGDADGDGELVRTSIRPFDPERRDSNGVVVDDRGGLVLGMGLDDDPTVWVANTGESTVSRIDADTGREIGRYPSALLDGSNRAQPLSEPCVMETNGNCPSRTAVDFVGNCYVANRGFGHQGTLTKIARNERDCVDRNGDGIIQTSRDANGDGVIDIDDPEEFFPLDECVVWTIDVGGTDDRPRALAIAPDATNPSASGNIWVGLNASWAALEISPRGEVLRTVELPIAPYGAVAAKYLGLVWFTTAAWQDPSLSPWLDDERYTDNRPAIVSVDFGTGEVGPRILVDPGATCVGSYGISVDMEGRVWLGVEQCAGAFRYDPSTGSWMFVDVTAPDMPYGLTRGIVGDRENRVWVAHSHCFGPDDPDCGLLTSFNADTGGDLVRYRIDGQVGSIGVDLDARGRAWVVNFNTHSASRVDPSTGVVDTFPVGRNPYTYSDFTGYNLLAQFPRGYYRHLIETCSGAQWVLAELDATVPPGTDVRLQVRSAETEAGLARATWHGSWTDFPADLQAAPGPVPAGAFLEIELTLISDEGFATPRVEDLVLSHRCPVR